MTNITPLDRGKPPYGNFRIIMITIGFLLAASFAIKTPEYRGEFIYLTAIMVKTWHSAGDSNTSEESDPLEKLEQSDEEKSDNSEEDDDSDNSTPAPH